MFIITIRRTFLIALMAFVFGIYVIPAAGTGPGEAGPLYERAAGHYRRGDDEKALSLFEDMVSKGYRSGNIFYALGNCYYRAGGIGRAVLNYERARRYIPLDSDLLSNYDLAKSAMKRADPPDRRPFPVRWLEKAFDYLTLRQMILLVLLAYYLLVIYIIIARVLRRFSAYSTLMVISGAILLAVLVYSLVHKLDMYRDDAIVVAKITDARYEPALSSPATFPLYEGMKVRVLREEDDWYRIQRPDMKIGWVKKGEAEKILYEMGESL